MEFGSKWLRQLRGYDLRIDAVIDKHSPIDDALDHGNAHENPSKTPSIRAADPPSADHSIAVVAHDGLPRSDAVLRFVESHLQLIVDGSRYFSFHGGGVVAE